MTWAFPDSNRPDLARAGEDLAEIIALVITSASECSEWRWLRTW